jgi:hypothetical protein
LGGFRPVPAHDPAAAKALATALELIRKDAAVGGLDLANPEVVQVERQIVAGQNFRTTARVGAAERRRALRAVVYRDLRGKTRLTSVELGPIGAKELPPAAGPVNDMPGGYTRQDVNDPGIKTEAGTACKLLADPAWLGRGVLLTKVEAASTQVVAGLNTHLTMRAAVKGGERTMEVVLYDPPNGQTQLSWARISAR